MTTSRFPQSNQPVTHSRSDVQTALQQDKQLVTFFNSLRDALYLIAERYFRRAKNDKINVNLPESAVKSQPDYLRGSLPASINPLQKLKGQNVDGDVIRQQESLLHTEQSQRNARLNAQIIQERVVEIPLHLMRGTSVRGTENRGIAVSKPNSRVESSKIPEVELVQMIDVDLSAFPPLFSINALLASWGTIAERKIGSYESPGMPVELTPMALNMELMFDHSNIFTVPKSTSKQFIEEVVTKPSIQKIADAIKGLIQKRLEMIARYPEPDVSNSVSTRA